MSRRTQTFNHSPNRTPAESDSIPAWVRVDLSPSQPGAVSMKAASSRVSPSG